MVLFVDALVEDGMVQQSVVWGENDKGDLVEKNIYIYYFLFSKSWSPNATSLTLIIVVYLFIGVVETDEKCFKTCEHSRKRVH